MPAAIPPELKHIIDEVLVKEAKLEDPRSNGDLAKFFKVSIPYIKKRKQALGISRIRPAAPAEASETKDIEPGEPVATKGYTEEVQPHGGRLIRGAHPRGGRPKGSKPGPASLQDIASFFNDIDPESVTKNSSGITYLERFLIGCVKQAESGKEAYASMILSALEKAGQTIKLTIENALPAGDSPKAVADPLFSAMDEERLRFEALRVLERQYSQPIEADYREVKEA